MCMLFTSRFTIETVSIFNVYCTDKCNFLVKEFSFVYFCLFDRNKSKTFYGNQPCINFY